MRIHKSLACSAETEGISLGKRICWSSSFVFGLSSFRSISVELHQLGEIELGFLQDLDLAHQDVLERENLAALFCDLLANLVGEKFLKEFL